MSMDILSAIVEQAFGTRPDHAHYRGGTLNQTAQIEIRDTRYFVKWKVDALPHFFETEVHVFVSNRGDVSARVREENDFLITQRLIVQPYAEINLFAQDVPSLDVGAGLSDGQIGLQTRYEFTRKFAPYVDLRYERKFGQTSSIARSNGEGADDVVGAVGLRLMF